MDLQHKQKSKDVKLLGGKYVIISDKNSVFCLCMICYDWAPDFL